MPIPTSRTTGGGFWAGGLTAGGATAEIVDDTVTDYRKAGIVAFDPDTFVTVTRNTVTGAGPTDSIAQNGTALQEGANGVVTHNTVAGNVSTPAGTEATGILVEAAGRAVVSHDRVFGNELGIAAVRHFNPLEISHNTVTRNTLDGIYPEEVVGAVVSHNKSTENGRSGVYATGQSSGNRMEKNDLRGNAGPDAYDDTEGPGTAGTANFWSKDKCDDDNRAGQLCSHPGHAG